MRLIVKCGFGPFIFDGSDSMIRWGRNELDSGWMHGRRRWIRCWFHANSLSFRSNHWSSPPELSRNCCIFRWQNHPDANGLADATESIPISSNSAEFTHPLKLDANQWNFWLFLYQFCVYSAWADVRMGRIRLKPDKTPMKSPIESSKTWRNCTGKFSQSNWQLTHPSARLDVRMQRIKNQSNRTKLASRHRSKPLNGKSVIKSNKQTKTKPNKQKKKKNRRTRADVKRAAEGTEEPQPTDGETAAVEWNATSPAHLFLNRSADCAVAFWLFIFHCYVNQFHR